MVTMAKHPAKAMEPNPRTLKAYILTIGIWAAIQVLLALLVLLRPVLAGEVYTWTDAEGNIHITDRPPQDHSRVEKVIRFSNPPETNTPPEPVPPQNSLETQQTAQLSKQLTRLKERQIQLEKSIAENQASIAAAEKEAAYYRKRSGSYARRNEKSIERQLVVLKNNLITHQSDLRYAEEDITETERFLEAINQQRQRPDGKPTPPEPAPEN